MEDLLRVEDLKTHFFTSAGVVKAVDGVSLSIPRGGRLGIVGESGSGKSVMAFSVLRLVSPPGRIVDGRIWLNRNGEKVDLRTLPDDKLREVRGGKIAMIFQEPMTSLNPVFTVGDQIQEAIILHQSPEPAIGSPSDAVDAKPDSGFNRGENPLSPRYPPSRFSRKERWEKVIESLKLVRIADPERVARAYPHELSGGMRQRVMIAMALSCKPDLLIADEPTTALDVTIQAQVLDLLLELQERLRMAFILITHDLGIIAETVEEVAVMYAGRIVEQAPTGRLFENPRHPYTRALLQSLTGLEEKGRLRTIPGTVPDLGHLPVSCAYQDRCERVQPVCREQEIALTVGDDGRKVRCLFPYD